MKGRNGPECRSAKSTPSPKRTRSTIFPSAPPRSIASAITSPVACSRVIQKATAAATIPVTATSVQRVVSVQLANIDSEMPQFSAQVRLKKLASSICPLGSSDSGTVTTHLTIWSRMKARSEEHTSELQSLMRISYAVFCLKKKKIRNKKRKKNKKKISKKNNKEKNNK